MNDNRRKLTGILKLLYENTDADHSMTTYQIMDALDVMGYGRPDRKTIDANIKFIIEDLGFGIRKDRGKPNRYSWIEREFDLSELKMLVDAVHSSRFISSRKTREIIAKLKDLTSVHQAAYLNHELYTKDNFKRDNSEALTNTDLINEAIKLRRRLRFKVVDYNPDKEEFFLNNGQYSEVSPYALIWSYDYYYMLALPTGGSKVQAYRVDLMKSLEIVYVEAVSAPEGFSINNYSSCVFDMLSGHTEKVTLLCDNSVMRAMIDRFGKGFKSELVGTDSFRAEVTTDLSDSFYSWVFSFGRRIVIESPDYAREAFRNMLAKQLEK